MEGKKVNQEKQVVKTTPDPWLEDKERLILYADFMGFKSRIFSKEHAVLKKELTEFHEKWSKKMEPLLKENYLRYAQFSDSILIAVNGTDDKMLNLLSKAATCLMHVALSQGFPIKGVIAQGLFSYDEENQLYFGKPLVDAFLLHEEIKYYGIVVHNTAEKSVKKHSKRYGNPYSHTSVCIDRGKVDHYHLCWNLIDTEFRLKNNTKKCEKWLDAIAESVSGSPRMYIDKTREILRVDADQSFKDYDTVQDVKDINAI
jgi:hypothetical protein